MDNISEYKILNDSSEICQKILNQWKYKYDLNIISMCKGDDNIINILLIRTVKENIDG